jgi:NAD+ synthase (glutamine-hydrolysing)
MNIALCPINPTVGNVSGNFALVAQAARQAAGKGAQIVVFPELALCGYPPRDLLLQSGFVEKCEAAAQTLLGLSTELGILIVAGTPRRIAPHAIANSLAVAQPGATDVIYYDKRLLPTYDVFDEDRYFVNGSDAVIVTFKGVRIGLTICEDLWRGEDAGFASRYQGVSDPVAELVARGVDLIVSPSASPFVLGKNGKHRAIVAGHARSRGVCVASVNQLGGNDDLVFDGHAFCYDASGELCCDGPLFVGDITYVTFPSSAKVTLTPREPAADLFAALCLGVTDYLRKCGFSKAVLGLSGGIDSALTAAIACAAIGPENVTGIMMPSKYSSEHSVSDARQLAANLGMRSEVLPIAGCVQTASDAVNNIFRTLAQPALGATLPDITEENLQSRLRGTLLMAVSNRTGAIVLTTGNKSEMAVGYCTLYGDMNGGLAVLSDVNKQWVYTLSRWLNDNYVQAGFAAPPIPVSSIEKPPSAELRPDQTDQDSLPPYEVLDALIEGYVEEHRSPQELVDSGFDAALVKRITRMIDLAEYKRKQAAVGLKVTAVAFGPGRRWPIAWRRGE